MSPGKLTVIVGLPGSGKSALVEEKRPVKGLCADDYHAEADRDSPQIEDSRHYRSVIETLRSGRTCVIADIAFCDPVRRDSLRDVFTREIADLNLEWIFFENAPEKCRRNILRRDRDVSNDLAELEKYALLYCVPPGVLPRVVHEAE